MFSYTKNPKRLSIVFTVFVVLIIVGLVVFRPPLVRYSMTPEQALSEIIVTPIGVAPSDALAMTTSKMASYIFVDIRDPYTFLQGHISGAVNISIQELFSKPTIKKFHTWQGDSTTVVLYGVSESAVNGAARLLRQTGFSNIKVLQGGYDAFVREQSGVKQDSIPRYKAEARWYDYASFLIPRHPEGSANTIAAPKAAPKKQVKALPPPVPHQDSGDEGC